MIEVFIDGTQEVKMIANKILEEIIDDFIEVGSHLNFNEIYGEAFPIHLRKNTEYCMNTLNKLYEYSFDKFIHELNVLEQYVLFHIIEFFIDTRDDSIDFSETINDYRGKTNYSDEDKYYLKNLSDPEVYKEYFFEDWDFLCVEKFIYLHNYSPELLEWLQIDLNEYFELIPEDILIKNQLQKKKLELEEIKSKEIFLKKLKDFIVYFDDVVKHKELYKIISKSDEKKFQIIFKNFADLFFGRVDIDISSEVHTGRGIVDFKFSIGKKYRALIEIKLDSNINTENGLNYQLPIYLHSENVDIGIFLLVIFKDQTMEKISEYEQMTLKNNDQYKKDFHFHYIDSRNNKKSGSTIKNADELFI